MRTFVQVGWAELLKVDKAAPLPLHFQLRESLRHALEQLGEGVQIPSESEIVAMTGVSRQTARRSVSDLVHEGLLQSQQGKGTFTVGARVETLLRGPRGFTDTIRDSGHLPGTKVISVELIQVERVLAAHLGIEAGEWAWRLERIRLIDGRPAMFELSHIVARNVPGLDHFDLDQSLYGILERKFGIRPAGGSEVIVAIAADSSLANLLGVEVGAPLLSTVRAATSQTGEVFEYTIRHARADVCSFRVALDVDSGLTSRSSESAVAIER